jgi:hypothetical protein
MSDDTKDLRAEALQMSRELISMVDEEQGRENPTRNSGTASSWLPRPFGMQPGGKPEGTRNRNSAYPRRWTT